MCFPEDAVSKRSGAGLLRSTREWMELLLDAGAAFLLTRDFFSITFVLCMTFLLVEGAHQPPSLTKAQPPRKRGTRSQQKYADSQLDRLEPGELGGAANVGACDMTSIT
jgi:hypothetical protein